MTNPFKFFAGVFRKEDILPLAPADADLDEHSTLSKGDTSKVLGKAPAIRWRSGKFGGFTGWRTHKATDADFDEWFAEGNNVGLRLTASDLVIDIDSSDPETSKLIEEKTVERLGASPLRVGGRGGMLFYRTDALITVDSIEFDANGTAEKVEVFTLGRQVALFGSHLTAESGAYRWPRPPKAGEPLSLVTQEMFDLWFNEVRDLLPQARRVKASKAKERREVAQEKLRVSPDRLGLLRDVVRKLPNTKAAFETRDSYIEVGYAFKAAFPDEQEAYDGWTEWAERYEDGCKPEVWEKDWRGIKPPFRIGADWLFDKAGELKVFDKSDLHYESLDDEEDEEPSTAIFPDEKPSLVAGRVSIEDLADLPPRQWLYGHKVLRKYVTFIASPGGVGKTAMIFAIALACAANKALLHDEPRSKRPLRVWIFNLEDDITELRRRLIAALQHYGLPPETLDSIRLNSGRDRGVKIVKLGQNGDFVVQPDYEAITAEIEREGIDLAIFDPFLRTHGVPENENEAQDEVMRLFAQIAERTNCGIVLVHHTKKGAIAGDMDSLRGGSTQAGGARAAFTLAPMAAEEAGRLGIQEAERRLYVRVDDAKNNMAPPIAKAEWLKLESHRLGNMTEDYPLGDSVQVAAKWVPPDAWDGVVGQDATILAQIEAGLQDNERYSARAQDKERWAGTLLVEEFDRTPNQAKEIIDTWVKQGVLEVRAYRSETQRKERKGLFRVGAPAVAGVFD